MNTEIWKYPLALSEFQHVTMQVGARALYAAERHGRIVIYAHVDPEMRRYSARRVWIHGTGHPTRFTAEAQPLGVVALEGGSLMFHVFIEPEPVPTLMKANS